MDIEVYIKHKWIGQYNSIVCSVNIRSQNSGSNMAPVYPSFWNWQKVIKLKERKENILTNMTTIEQRKNESKEQIASQ